MRSFEFTTKPDQKKREPQEKILSQRKMMEAQISSLKKINGLGAAKKRESQSSNIGLACLLAASLPEKYRPRDGPRQVSGRPRYALCVSRGIKLRNEKSTDGEWTAMTTRTESINRSGEKKKTTKTATRVSLPKQITIASRALPPPSLPHSFPSSPA